MTNIAPVENHVPGPPPAIPCEEREFLSFVVGEQLFGLPLLAVQDVLDSRRLTPIPLAPSEIAGALNLRGRIITAVDMRRRLHMASRAESDTSMSVVVDHDGELYNLLVDTVGDVLRLSDDAYEDNPATMDPQWRGHSDGVYRLEDRLMVVLNVRALLDFGV